VIRDVNLNVSKKIHWTNSVLEFMCRSLYTLQFHQSVRGFSIRECVVLFSTVNSIGGFRAAATVTGCGRHACRYVLALMKSHPTEIPAASVMNPILRTAACLMSRAIGHIDWSITPFAITGMQMFKFCKSIHH